MVGECICIQFRADGNNCNGKGNGNSKEDGNGVGDGIGVGDHTTRSA